MRGGATVRGAVSLVNAVATRRGATLGIGLEVRATVEARPGSGVAVDGGASQRLVRATVRRAVPARRLAGRRVLVSVESGIPAGYGLKSSSAVSSAVALACSRAFGLGLPDRRVLLAGVEASVESGVSITGAYDDACSCYYGGFNVTDNAARRRVRHEPAPRGLEAAIYVPARRRRGRPRRLAGSPRVFERAWGLAADGRYWEAMSVNGFAAARALNSDPALVARLLAAGALGASVSGNGPAVAAVARRADMPAVRAALAGLGGRVITSPVSNRRAESWSAG